MITLLLATRNLHKVAEIRAILGDKFRYLTLSDFPDAPEVIEDAATFAGNATKKAVQLAKWAGRAPWPGKPKDDGKAFVLADDSGLEVDALAGAPGVYSARFAAIDHGLPGNSSAQDNNAKLVRLLEDVPLEKRSARFRCVVALTPLADGGVEIASPVCYAEEHEVSTRLFEGTCEGRLELLPRGKGGFGYDPLFVPEGFSETFAELGEDTKNQLSHRARALEQLAASFRV